MIELQNLNDLVCIVQQKTFRVLNLTGLEVVPRVPCRVADIPPGVYKIGNIIAASEINREQTLLEYGSFFCDILLLDEPVGFKGRSGVGIHGGSAQGPVGPNNPMHDWPYTRGVKLQDSDLNRKAIPVFMAAQKTGGTIYLDIVE